MTQRMPRRSPTAGERQRDPERTKGRIIDAAIAEFGTKGFAGARVSEIADRAGVNKQLISYYFGGKQGLYNEIAERWQQTSADMAGPERPLDAVVAEFTMANLHNRDWAKLMVRSNLESSAEAPDEQADRGYMQAQVADIRRRQAAGELPDDLDPAYFMLALFAAAAASVTLPRVTRMIVDEDPESEDFATRYAEQLARLVRHLRPGPD